MDEAARRQAGHFDEHEPISPWPELMRNSGFRFNYIAKDLLIERSIEAATISPGTRVLDIGCGSGVLLDRIGTTYGTTGTGIDISARSLSRAKSRAVTGSRFVVADARSLPFASHSYNLVICLDVLEHIERSEVAVNEMLRIATADARVIIYAISARNNYTLQWFERLLLSRIGIDLDFLACHSRDLLVDPKSVSNVLHRNDQFTSDIQHFHGFFSSLFDRAWLLGYLVLKKIGLLSAKTPVYQYLGVVILTAATIAARIALDILLKLDGPWFVRGYSNGFLAVGRNSRTAERF